MPIFDSHSWRQADGYAITRNFLEEDANIFFPRIDHRGDLTGITGGEFPIMNYLTYLIYLLTGVQWFPGRLLNLIVSSAGIYAFYKLIKEFFNKDHAFSASLILLVSIWFSFSRKFMPDTFSASLVISGIYFGLKFGKTKKVWQLSIGTVFLSIGLLSKISSFVILAFAVPFILDQTISKPVRLKLILAFGFSLIPVIWWYFIWVPSINAEYGLQTFFLGKSIDHSIPQLIDRFPDVLKRFYQDAFYFSAFGLFILGMIQLIKNRSRKSLILLISSFVLLFIYLLKSGFNFAEHNYYIIPFVPFMCFFAGKGLNLFRNSKIKTLIIGFVLLECILNQSHEFRSKKEDRRYLSLEEVVSKHIPFNQLIAVNGKLNPNLLYFAHRKGWTFFSEELTEKTINEITAKGCRYIIWDNKHSKIPSVLSAKQPETTTEYWTIWKTPIIN